MRKRGDVGSGESARGSAVRRSKLMGILHQLQRLVTDHVSQTLCGRAAPLMNIEALSMRGPRPV